MHIAKITDIMDIVQENLLTSFVIGFFGLHYLLRYTIGINTDSKNKFWRAFLWVFELLDYHTCATCRNERCMFTPDTHQPCWSMIKSLQEGRQSAPKPCRLTKVGTCQYYHGWRNEKGLCVQSEVLKTLYHARKSIHLCMYSFTNSNLCNCLTYLSKNKGVRVYILTNRHAADKRQENDQIPVLQRAGFKVKFNSDQANAMHNKYCIVDEQVMISGSLNWTHNAFSSNDEMITWNRNPKTIKTVLQKFNKSYKTK